MSEINKEILNNPKLNQEILNSTREFWNKHSESFISLFDTLKNSSIDSKLNKLESRIV